MGREAKLLLALLGLLTGVLAGVVSMKLFVPRPPAGAGPDIHGAAAAIEVQELVEPPALSLPNPGDFESADAVALPARRFAPRAEPLSSEPPATAVPSIQPPPAVRDPLVAPASFAAESELAAPADLLPPPAELEPAPATLAAPPASALVADPRGVAFDPAAEESVGSEPTSGFPATGPRGFPRSEAALASPDYVAKPGDSWWSLAEHTYGDGRLYRALFAWNRARDPRISLVPGTRLELPPADRLQAAWPGLMPRQ